jgi:hypothetical protein
VLGRVSSGDHRRRCAVHGETGERSGSGMDAEAASVSNRIAGSKGLAAAQGRLRLILVTDVRPSVTARRGLNGRAYHPARW